MLTKHILLRTETFFLSFMKYEQNKKNKLWGLQTLCVYVISDISWVCLRVFCTYCDACPNTLSLSYFGHIKATRSKELIRINKLMLIFSRLIFEFWRMASSMTNNLSARPFSFVDIAISVIISKCLNNLRLKQFDMLLLCMSLLSSCAHHRWLAYFAVIFFIES